MESETLNIIAEYKNTMGLSDWITIFAIVIGPLLGMGIVRYLDNRRERDSRRMDIFKTLMRTRRVPLSHDHVSALNMVEIEFGKDEKVMKHWKDLHKAFSDRDGKADIQTPKSLMLSEMAKSMGVGAEQLEIFQGGYAPQGWEEIENEQQIIRKFLLELKSGDVSFPIKIINDASVNQEEKKS